MRNTTIRFIYDIKRNALNKDDPVENVVDFICKDMGLAVEYIDDRAIYTFVRESFRDFLDSSDNKSKQFERYIYARDCLEMDSVHAMLFVLVTSMVRNENMEYINGFRDIDCNTKMEAE